MGTAVIGALRVVLGLDAATFETGLSAARKSLREAGKSMEAIGKTMAGVGAGLTVSVTAPLLAAGFAASRAATESRDAMGQVEAALKSMGNQAGQTKESLAAMATDIMRNSLEDDDDVLRKVTANLLTFGKVGGDQFRRAQIAAVDLATRMKTDLQSATILVGKALNDPVRGMGALRKAGVQLDEGQQKLVKSLVATGDVAGAQRILLSELEAQFGGSAKAAQDTDPYDSLRDSLNDLSESMGAIINEHIKPLIDGVAKLAQSFNALSPQMQNFALAGAVVAAGVGPALIAIGSLVTAVGAITTAFAAGGAAVAIGTFVAAAAPFIAAAAGIAAAIWVFRDDLIPVFDDFRKAVADAVGPSIPPLIAAAQAAFAALGPAIKTIGDIVGPVLAFVAKAFVEAFGPPLIAVLKIGLAAVTAVVEGLAQTLRFIAAILTGDWSTAWRAAGSIVGVMAQGIGRVIDAIFPGALEVITRMVDGVKRVFNGPLFQAFEAVIRRTSAVGDAFFRLYDRVVGHSYVPDMVDEIGQQMARLQQVMNAPVDRATKSAADRFAELRENARGVMEGLLTDQERLNLDYLKERKKLTDAIALGGPQASVLQTGLARLDANYRRDSAGVDAQGLTNDGDHTLGSLSDLPGVSVVDDAWRSIQNKIRQSREDFADAFEGGITAALHGDWAGVLQSLFGNAMRDGLRGLGSSLFDKLAGGSGKGMSFSSIGSLFKTALGGLPGFAGGGSILPGGSGGIDSQLVSFWKSPGEQVDIYHPGSDSGPVGARITNLFDLSGALMTSDLLADINGRIRAGEARSVRTASAIGKKSLPGLQQSMGRLGTAS